MESHQFDHISHVLCAILEELQAVRGLLLLQQAPNPGVESFKAEVKGLGAMADSAIKKAQGKSSYTVSETHRSNPTTHSPE
ncbi:hypothetical protein [Solidesulfovibrio sp.]